MLGLDYALRLVLPRGGVASASSGMPPRWHLLPLGEAPALGLADARISAQALIAIGGEHVERGVAALSELLERARARGAHAALDEWVELLAGR